MSEPLLVLQDLVKQFPVGHRIGGRAARVHAVDGVSLEVRRGEVLALVGESGSGKSTLGRCVTGMDTPTSGRIVFEGRDLAGLSRRGQAAFRRRVQPVFQDPRSSLDPRWPVSRTIQEPLDANRVGTRSERLERVGELMDLVGLPRYLAGRRPGELSGGQQQRVAIAAALALGPDLVVADEPVSALDVSVQAQILNLLDSLRSRLGLALLFIAHDLSVVGHLADRVAVMYLGRVVEVGSTQEIFDRPRHPYTQALIEAIPYPDPTRPMVVSRLKGEIPSPIDPPPGCHFHTRCPLALDRCRQQVPQPTSFSPTHSAACFVAAEDPPTDQVGTHLTRGAS